MKVQVDLYLSRVGARGVHSTCFSGVGAQEVQVKCTPRAPTLERCRLSARTPTLEMCRSNAFLVQRCALIHPL